MMSKDRNGRNSSVLGETAVIVGNVNGAADFEIRGRIQGNIVIQGKVVVAESGSVEGSIHASQLNVAGTVHGDVSAEDTTVIHASGRIEGDISGARVAIEAGASIQGMLSTGLNHVDDSTTPPPKRNQPVHRQLKPDNSKSRSSSASEGDSSTSSARGQQQRPEQDKVNREGRARLAKKQRSDKAQPETAPSLDTDGPPLSSQSPSSASSTERRPSRDASAASKKEKRRSRPDEPVNTSKEAVETPVKPEPEKPRVKKPRRRGPPQMPTFVAGTKGHKRG